MNVLELFKGTGSVGKVCESMGHNVISVDIVERYKPTHLCDIMDFDYKQYPKNYFQIIWGSPPCTEYSKAKTRGIRDIDGANKTVLKTLEIINYFDCEYWYIENPQTSLLKKQTFMETLPYIDCDYCMYGKPYRKRTRIWTNKKKKLKLCDKNCGSFINGRHIGSCGNGRSKYCDKVYTLEDKYSIPPDLIFSLLFD
jgi:site-specific DNA-cytosine methylase